MKKLSALFVFLIPFFLLSTHHSLALACDYTVSNVNGLLNAKNEIRTINDSMIKDIVVCLKGGNYYLNDTISFTPEDSGTNGHKVIYKNYQNQRPVIIGGQPITNWQPANISGKPKISKANVGNWKFYNLMENGTLSTMARHPNSGWISAPDSPAYNQLTFGDGDLPSFFDYDDAQLSIKLAAHRTNEYFAEVLPITNVDWDARTIIVHKRAYWWPFNAGTRYFARGSLDFLDQAGEYYLDESTGWLYYWPMNLPIEDQEIVAPKVKRIIELMGSSTTNLVEHIKFEGLTFRLSDFTKEHGMYYSVENGTDHAMIFMNNAKNIEIRYCDIRFAGFSGVAMYEYAQNNTVYGTCIKDVGAYGVQMRGYNVGVLEYVNKSNTVSNCYLANGGLFWPQGDAIWVYQSGNNEIVHNEIIHWPNNGIVLVSKNYTTMKLTWGDEINWANHWDWLYTRDNNVAFNNISHVLESSSDGGGIHTFGTGHGNVINNNRVHDFTAGNTRNDSTIGIYQDGDSSDITVTNNIVYGVGTGSKHCYPILSAGDCNTYDNNVIVDNFGTLSWTDAKPIEIWFKKASSSYPDADYGHHTSTHNIFYRTNGYYAYAASQGGLDNSNHNVFYHPGGSVQFYKRGNLDRWKAVTGYDAASIEADPLFTDQANHDYSLKPGSPALALGIKSIDQDSIGIQETLPCMGSDPTSTPTPTPPMVVEQIMISNFADFHDANTELFATTKSWTLTSGEGEKTVWVKFKMSDGTWTNPVFDTIVLETTGPTPTPSPTPTSTPIPTPIPSLTPTPTPTPVSTPTPSPTTAPTPTPKFTPTPTPEVPTPTPIFPPSCAKIDFNGNGVVDILDWSLMVEMYGQTGEDLPGDFNGDGEVNILDVSIFMEIYNRCTANG